MSHTTLINNATVIFPDKQEQRSVLLEDGKIQLSFSTDIEADQIIDATGLHLIPGVIDDQVHFREPGLTHKEDLFHASQACAAGGITSFLEMPNTKPTTTTVERLHEKLATGAENSIVNYGFYIGATLENVEELKAAQRTPGIKIFIGSSTGNMLVDDQQVLEQIFAETTIPICAHCEDEQTVRDNAARLNGGSEYTHHSQIRDHKAAIIATRRAIDLAQRHHHRFHVLHVSTGPEADYLVEYFAEHPANPENRFITAEVCPHHLLFNIEDYDRLGSLVQMNPSIKTKVDNARLWQALQEGSIQVIATDHAPHTLEEKNQPYPDSPSGLPAVENSLALMLNAVHEGKLTLQQVVHSMCEAPAAVWDIVDRGKIEDGYAADVVLVDLNLQKTIHNEKQRTKCGWSPWDDVTLTGWPVKTWVNGQLVYSDDQVDTSIRGQEIQFDHSRTGYWS